MARSSESEDRSDFSQRPPHHGRVHRMFTAGELTDGDLEAEIRDLPRGWQNDLLYYLALARGGDRAL
ncbi:MAG: hypothetical protein HZA23_07415, partial [Nitrospirae bacterium]|nr:hypothetical protein [Nitrospirota bacterium]